MDAYVKMPETYKNRILNYFTLFILIDLAVLATVLL